MISCFHVAFIIVTRNENSPFLVTMLHVFLNNFFAPRVDVSGGRVGVQISNDESTLSVAQRVWMASLIVHGDSYE